jgi:hypothetical protein
MREWIFRSMSSALEMRGRLHVPAALLLGKGPWYPLDRKLGNYIFFLPFFVTGKAQYV